MVDEAGDTDEGLIGDIPETIGSDGVAYIEVGQVGEVAVFVGDIGVGGDGDGDFLA